MQRILGLAGRKQSGKNTSFNCLKLWVPDAQEFAFADSLKRMCIDILGLTVRQCYGSDDDKNTLVPHLLWENFPVPAWSMPDGSVYIESSELGKQHIHNQELRLMDALLKRDIVSSETAFKLSPLRKLGPMTAREVMQFWGTEIYRRAYGNVWADACIRKIRQSGCELAVITDCRFPNELETIQEAGGKVLKLTRNIFPEDKHPSETAFDEENFDQSRFDGVLDNRDMDVSDQCEALYGILRRWGYVEHKNVGRIHV